MGLEVESVTDRAAALAPFRIAEVLEAVPHPNADRLKACRSMTGSGLVSVVCGAPNARTGMKAVFAPPGSVIPGSGITLKKGQIRGVESAGMLLSAREMGLGEDHDGIIELPADAPVGETYAHWAGLDDPVIEIAVTPNRGDALAVRGDRARSRRRRDRDAAALGRASRARAVRKQARVGDRLARSLPLGAGAHLARGAQRAEPALARREADRDRAAADQCARRYHEFFHLRPRADRCTCSMRRRSRARG